jgi:hypothetical protein
LDRIRFEPIAWVSLSQQQFTIELKTTLKLIAGLVLAAGLIGSAFMLVDNSLSLETDVRHFATKQELTGFAGTNDWWAPKFLPESSRSIRQKFHGDYGTCRVAAKFSPLEASTLLSRLSDVPESEWDGIVPHWGSRVFPRKLMRGDFASLTQEGYRIASVRGQSGAKQPWFVAVNIDQGTIYAWNVNR